MPYSRARQIIEAIVEVPQAEVDKMLAELRWIAQKSQDVREFTTKAKERFKNYHLTFTPRADFPPGVPGAASEDGLYLRPPDSLRDINSWLSFISQVLHHELIHMIQIERSGPNAAKMSDSAIRMTTRNGQMDMEGYRRQKQEIMAFAGTLINNWRQHGLSKEQMKARLRSGDWNSQAGHAMLRKTDPKSYNLFLKYAVEYIERQAIPTTGS